MDSGNVSSLKRFIFWDYPRAGWQYDVVVALILAFIFLTPREVFRDRPRTSQVVELPAEHGASVFWIESDLLSTLPEERRSAQASREIQSRFGRRNSLIRLEPIFDSEREIKGYLAYTK